MWCYKPEKHYYENQIKKKLNLRIETIQTNKRTHTQTKKITPGKLKLFFVENSDVSPF